jgi:hypothetical protein
MNILLSFWLVSLFSKVVSLSSRRGSPDRFRRVGIDGPKMSVSRIPVRIPRRAKERARFTNVRGPV